MNCDSQKHKRENADSTIPPGRNFRVELHQARMDIAFILQCASESAKDISTEPHCKNKSSALKIVGRIYVQRTESMDEDSCEGGKGYTISHAQRSRHVQGRIGVVLLNIESAVGDDSCWVIRHAGIVI